MVLDPISDCEDERFTSIAVQISTRSHKVGIQNEYPMTFSAQVPHTVSLECSSFLYLLKS